MKQIKEVSEKNADELCKIVEIIKGKFDVIGILLYGHYAGMEESVPIKGYKFLIISKEGKIAPGLIHRYLGENYPSSNRLVKSIFFISVSQNVFNSEVHKNFFFNRLKREGIFLYRKPGENIVQKNRFACSVALKSVQKEVKFNFGWGSSLLRLAQEKFLIGEIPLSTFFVSLAISYFLVVVVRVYYGIEISVKTELGSIFAYARQCDTAFLNLWDMPYEELKKELKILYDYRTEARNQPDFIIKQKVLKGYIKKTETLEKIARQVCDKRIKTLIELK